MILSHRRSSPVFRSSRDPSLNIGWTLDTLRDYVLTLIAALTDQQQQLRAADDLRFAQRFEASQSAIAAAFLAQQTAMQTALAAQKLAVDTALTAADRASTKAEVSADKRFEGLNELRGMVTDQQAAFIQRLEAVALITALTDKVAALAIAMDAKSDIQRVASDKSMDDIRKDISNLHEFQSNILGRFTVLGGSIAVVMFLISVTVTVILRFIK